MAASPEARPRRRRGRGLVIFLVVLLLLGGLAIGADRIAATVAEKEVTQRLVAQAEQRGVTAASTEVQIGGFPFLTQVAKGKYERVTITMHEARAKAGTGAGARQINLNELVVVAGGVNADTGELLQGQGEISADSLTGTARIGWADLAALTDHERYGVTQLRFAPEGERIRVVGRLRVGQFDLDFTAAGRVVAQGGKLNLTVSDLKSQQLNVDAGLAPGVLPALSSRLSQALTPPALPFGLVITDVHPEADGLSVSATGEGVPLRQ